MCYKCLKPLIVSAPISRTELCPHCGSDVRCCKNCKHYSLSSHFECKEHIQEHIVEKERSNFCDWFSLNAILDSSEGKNGVLKTEKAKNDFNALFGD